MLDPRTRQACVKAINCREIEYARGGQCARDYRDARRVLDSRREDKRALAACLRALQAREMACARHGLSTLEWARARRLVRDEMLMQSAADMRADVPVFLQRQAG